MIIDIHAHIIPESFIRMVEQEYFDGVALCKESYITRIKFPGGSFHPYTPLFYSIDDRLKFMQEHGIDCQLVSISPRLFFYELPGEKGAEVSRCFNDDILALQRQYPGKIVTVATVPLQDTDLSIKELLRVHELGVKSVQIGTSINGKNPSEAEFEPFFEAAAALGVTIILHPLIINSDPLMKDYHISNLVGNPWQTTVAAGNMIFSGMFSRIPDLKICLVHGGGFLPYQLGRMCHGYKVRQEAKKHIDRAPDYYVRNNIYFDGLTHSRESLEFLIKVFGSERVMYGTDYPYDMAEYDQIEKMIQLGFADEDILKVACKNAESILI